MTRRTSNVSVVAALLGLGLACAELTEPGPSAGQSTPAPAPTPVAVSAAAAAPTPPTRPPAAPQEQIKASHVLIAYKAARRSRASRTKAEAKKLADAVLKRAKAGEDFADLARKHSDDPSAKAKGGDLGSFHRGMMVKPFADAAFALKPGEVSDVVETEFGFHVIRRTE